MEILVLLMISLFLAIIAVVVGMFVVLRKTSIKKNFNKRMMADDFEKSLHDDFPDDEIEEFPIINYDYLVKPSRIDDENNHEEDNSRIIEEPTIVRETIKETNDTPQYEDVVNILISKKNYIFLANGYNVLKNDKLKVIISGKVYYGVVTKGNYNRDIKTFKVKPHKLVLLENKINKKDEGLKSHFDEEEFIPKKRGDIKK